MEFELNILLNWKETPAIYGERLIFKYVPVKKSLTLFSFFKKHLILVKY